MSTYKPGDATPIRGVEHLRESLRPRGEGCGRLGLEWELLPCDPEGRLAPYAGRGGVERAFLSLAERGYDPHRERGRVVGLGAPSGSFLGLEPGAQIEVATPPMALLSDLRSELDAQRKAIQWASSGLGWGPVPWGLAPHDGPEGHPDVPKERYVLLGDHLRRKGRLGRWMMKLAAASQFNLDTPGTAGLEAQVGGALRILPYLAGWLANSPVARGRRGRWKTRRPWIWRHTDRGRCGLPRFLFRESRDAVGDWVRYYLGREALFFVRDGRWAGGQARTFAQWLAEPGPLAPLTLDDWFLHISGTFPDLRFRGYIEIRTADSVPLETLVGAGALCKGLLGDPGRVKGWSRLLPDPEPAAVARDLLIAAKGGGLWSPPGGPAAPDVAPGLFREAELGLKALGEEPGWLEPVERAARSGRCPSDGWVRVPGPGWLGPGREAPREP